MGRGGQWSVFNSDGNRKKSQGVGDGCMNATGWGWGRLGKEGVERGGGGWKMFTLFNEVINGRFIIE